MKKGGLNKPECRIVTRFIVKFAFQVSEDNMQRYFSGIVFLFLIYPAVVYSQDTDAVPSYQVLLMNNPALSGSEGEGVLRISYLNFYPGNGYNLHSMYLSYDSYFQALHGGAAVWLSEDYLGGSVNNTRGGLSYSYFMQAGEDLFINAGLSAAVFHRGFNFSSSVLPDQIDPLGGVAYPSAEVLGNTGRTVFDLNTGITVTGRYYSGGLAVAHLAEPDISDPGADRELIKRKVLVHLCGDFAFPGSTRFRLRPLGFMSRQDRFVVAGGGISLESENIGVSVMGMDDEAGKLDMQAGFSFKAGIIRFSYAYRLNIISGNDLLPVSLLHQAGLAFSLNDVNKRNSIKTIKFPKL